MPLTHIPTDISLHIIACLPLDAIGRVKQVQKSWKNMVDTNENGVYRNAALLHQFVLSVGTSLLDAISALDFDTSPSSISGWREFCEFKIVYFRLLFINHAPTRYIEAWDREKLDWFWSFRVELFTYQHSAGGPVDLSDFGGL